MPRNISFSMTTEQIRNRAKTVTRRKGWKSLRPGDVLNACVKCMGLKPGEKIERLGQIVVVDVRLERLSIMSTDRMYGKRDAAREGFPELTGNQFVAMFLKHMGGDVDQIVTRIQFDYLDGGPG